MAYSDIRVRYWFSSDDSTALNHWIDYAALGDSNISGTFTTLSPGVSGADHYVEFSVNPSLGDLYPSTNTGNIHFRIEKNNWSSINPTDDYSYLNTGSFALNDHVTLY